MRGPRGEVDDLVRVRFVFQNLIGALAGFLADACGVIEHFFPGRIIGDFVNDEDVGHEKRAVRVDAVAEQ